ncbi:putative nuclear MIS12/MIND complex subunit PMF1/Nnf1 protein [Helianthus anomalus]
MANGHGESDLKRSFKLGLHGLLTTCSKEEFCKAFPGFTNAEKERLHHLYIQVIVSLHKNIERIATADAMRLRDARILRAFRIMRSDARNIVSYAFFPDFMNCVRFFP